MNKQILLIFTCCIILQTTFAKDNKQIEKQFKIKDKDMMRKSIVFDKNTPDVFYCPSQKPSGFEKLIVRSRPLHKLCELEGKPIPEDYKSDCYQDVDESDFACKEKYRIMMRMYPPGSDAPYNGTRLKRFLNIDDEIKLLFTKNSDVKIE